MSKIRLFGCSWHRKSCSCVERFAVPTGAQEVYKTRRSDYPPYRILSISKSNGIVNFFGSSLMESSRILRIAIFAKTFILLKSPSASFTICAVPAEKLKQISLHSSSSFAYRCTALYSYAAAAIFCFYRSASIPPR